MVESVFEFRRLSSLVVYCYYSEIEIAFPLTSYCLQAVSWSTKLPKNTVGVAVKLRSIVTMEREQQLTVHGDHSGGRFRRGRFRGFVLLSERIPQEAWA